VSQQGRSILVVEDDAGLRMVFRVTLELERFRVLEADGLSSAREALAAERPALVFLDIHLGAESGEELIEELASAGIPVVIVSGSIDLRPYQGLAAEVLGKPFEPLDLVAAARRHLVG